MVLLDIKSKLRLAARIIVETNVSTNATEYRSIVASILRFKGYPCYCLNRLFTFDQNTIRAITWYLSGSLDTVNTNILLRSQVYNIFKLYPTKAMKYDINYEYKLYHQAIRQNKIPFIKPKIEATLDNIKISNTTFSQLSTLLLICNALHYSKQTLNIAVNIIVDLFIQRVNYSALSQLARLMRSLNPSIRKGMAICTYAVWFVIGTTSILYETIMTFKLIKYMIITLKDKTASDEATQILAEINGPLLIQPIANYSFPNTFILMGLALVMVVLGCVIVYGTCKLMIVTKKYIQRHFTKKLLATTIDDDIITEVTNAVNLRLATNHDYLYSIIKLDDEAMVDYCLCLSDGLPLLKLADYTKLLEDRDISGEIKEKVCFWMLWGNYWQMEEKQVNADDYFSAYTSQICTEMVIT
jgi:hypothetical protein